MDIFGNKQGVVYFALTSQSGQTLLWLLTLWGDSIYCLIWY